MDIKDVNLNIKIKSNKVTKVLHLLFTDAIADFQKSHPKSIPSLLLALNKGDTEKAIDKIDHFLALVEELKDSVENIKEHILKSMPPVVQDEERGGKTFINPDGVVVHKLSESGDSSVVAGPNKPIKRTARKTKTKNTEE